LPLALHRAPSPRHSTSGSAIRSRYQFGKAQPAACSLKRRRHSRRGHRRGSDRWHRSGRWQAATGERQGEFGARPPARPPAASEIPESRRAGRAQRMLQPEAHGWAGGHVAVIPEQQVGNGCDQRALRRSRPTCPPFTRRSPEND
jgi:hypothetical protein